MTEKPYFYILKETIGDNEGDGDDSPFIIATVDNRNSPFHHEGPLEIPEGTFDFYSILSRPKVWETEEDEEDIKSVSGNKIKLKSPPTSPPLVVLNKGYFQAHTHTHVPCCNLIKPRESEIWGSMQESTADSTEESSTPPSLTSIAENEKKVGGVVEDFGKVTDEEMIRDENNNVLATIKNTIYRSFSFFETSRPSTSTVSAVSPTAAASPTIENGSTGTGAEEKDRKEAVSVVDYEKGDMEGSLSTSKEPDQVNESEGKINTQPCHNSNIHNSPTPSGISLRGSSKDSALIPVKIEEQLQKAQYLDPGLESVESQQEYHTSAGELKNRFSLETKLEKCEVVKAEEPLSNEEPPSLTKLPKSGSEIKDSSSQLVLNGSERGAAAVNQTATRHFNDFGKSATSISPKSSYVSAATLPLPDEKFVGADTVENSVEFDSQQTQTQSADSHDAETGTENKESESKREKLMSLVMAVNTGIDITPSQEQCKNSVKLRGIMKACRTDSEWVFMMMISQWNILSYDIIFSPHFKL